MAITLDGTAGITTPDLTDTSLTSGRVVYAGTGGNLTGSAALTFDGSTTFLQDASGASAQANFRVQTNTAGAVANGYFNINGTDYFRIYGTSGETGLRNPQNTPMFFSTNNTERMRIPAAGGVQAVTTISVGNATPSASGAGITFPATQSASSDANTLDDYEEGTFTPSLTGSGGGAGTYTARDGIYVKVGKMVTVNFWIYSNTKNTLSGTITLTGLPFASSSTASFSGYRPSPAMRTTALTSVTGTVGGWVGSSSTAINLQINNNGGATDLTATNLPTSVFEIGGSLSYITD